jgi:hypothetical protein
MYTMNITDAKYVTNFKIEPENEAVSAIIDGVQMTVPMDPANTHYAEIMRQVEAGELTIADADPQPE